MSFPDFDFGAVRPKDFCRVSVNTAIDRINKLLSDVAIHKEAFLTDLWTSLNDVIHLPDCDIYSYQPRSSDDQDDDPMAFLTETLTEGSVDNNNSHASPVMGKNDTSAEETLGSQPSNTTIWTFNYFFVNKTAKRIVLFTCVESMRNHDPGLRENDDDDDEGAFVPLVADSTEIDFDLDPASAPAGGIPISTV